ncbi:iron chelate uptake ABC transporter family permease subunit [Lactococcus fujiensis]|uniref:iron chelate uptake ABC transporter family permease subunit n=1 Tax=Lactococcus fujiensis TaxID=610251 RepID=UPI000AE77C68|nr:iron chelate uptake ABC transporter family permease subunit [Lactococcus fujiensis]
MKKKFLLLGSLLIGLIILNLTQFSTNWEMLSILVPNFRLPRLIFLLAAGVSLSISGLIIQTVTENPLADSSTIGITSGASAGAVIFLLLSNHLHLSGNWNFAYPFFCLRRCNFEFYTDLFTCIKKECK